MRAALQHSRGAASVQDAAGDGTGELPVCQSRYGPRQPGSHGTRAKLLVRPSGLWDTKKRTL